MSTEKLHAKFSASGSERWLNCPGSIAQSAGLPDLPESEYAKEGTLAHECLEVALKSYGKPKLKEFLLAKYTPEMVEHALSTAQWITKELQPGNELLCETKVDLSFIEPGMFGTLDAAIVRHYGRLTVIDYKYGSGIAVEPCYDSRINSQLAYYALGISHLHDHNFSEIEFVIIQPRAFHESGETIRTATFPSKDLEAWEEVFREGVRKAKEPFPVLKSGKWCRFCPASHHCPEIKDNAMREAQVVFSDDAGVESVPEPRMLPLDKAGVILDACDKLETWIAAYKKHLFHLLETGHKVPGCKLVPKRALRKWKDEAEAAAKASKLYWAAEAFETKLLSPAQLEKKICKKGVWSDATNGFLEEFVVKESSGLTLARDTDTREGISLIDNIFGE